MSGRCGATRATSLLLLAAAAACGKEGPPLPPLRPQPGQISEVSARRIGDRIEIEMQIPAANADGTTPPVMERVEVYMLQPAAGAPAPGVNQLVHDDNLRTVIPVRSPEETKAAPPPKTLIAMPGGTTTLVETVDPSAPGTGTATRYYALVGASGRSRRSRPSPLLAIPLGGEPAPPAGLTAKYDQETFTLTWTAAAGQTYRVYEASGPGAGATATELTTAPVTQAQFTLPTWFGSRRCFAVRAIQTTDAVSIAGPVGPGVCETPADTFAPAAPSGLFATQEGSSVILRWAASDAPDLAGYIVLRGEDAGETLSPVMKTPMADPRYADSSVVAGTTYVYAVVAVDRAGNQSAPSNRQQVTVRRP